ncbi:methyltransferase family protein [Paraburkholderia sp.]|uniref:methyltransferase family protein n=1 Tax=Paraburkholderia sp. TaxID=1926495 RepID=UPI003D6EAF04
MNIIQSIAILLPWTIWLIYWIATSKAVKATAKREGVLSRRLQAIPLVIGGVLITVPAPVAALWTPDLGSLGTVQLAGELIQLAGLGFSVWARRYLGTNWSVSVTLKEGHELVRNGPYRLVRHPIYTGCLLALVGSALINGQWFAFLGVALIFASLAYKVRVEESWLTDYFGDAYRHYRLEVSALIPGLY